MSAFHPHADDLPREIPVFPLAGALLLPGGKLPLNIFEPRYLAMVEDALGAGRVFGMVQPDAAAPPDPATGEPRLYRIGCLGRINSFSETDDGRYLITLTGLLRYRIEAELAPRRGYRRMRVEYGPFLAELDPTPQPLDVARETLLAALRGYFTRRGFDANWDTIRNMADPVLISTLCMVCPFEPAEKQALLEAPDQTARAGALLALLQMGAVEPQAPAGGGRLS
ncbi:MAG: LON peptidase substrate-binding domain-containing protein [Rhodospirillales bacterium]|jgi:Lon protease-like protein|nr:LON peptidase substrate-binding domain-containing protein [Rhodospirillales bacterium]